LALKEVDLVSLHRQSGIHAQEIKKFKIAPHKQKSIVKKLFWQEDGHLANGALCLSTPKHNGKSDTSDIGIHFILITVYVIYNSCSKISI